VRAGRGMSRLTRRVAPRRPEEAILGAPRRDTAVTAAVLALTAVAFAAAADHGVLAHIQRVDDAWLRLMVSGRSAPVTVIAKFFNLLGVCRLDHRQRGGRQHDAARRKRHFQDRVPGEHMPPPISYFGTSSGVRAEHEHQHAESEDRGDHQQAVAEECV
jgi:hypothetical protein